MVIWIHQLPLGGIMEYIIAAYEAPRPGKTVHDVFTFVRWCVYETSGILNTLTIGVCACMHTSVHTSNHRIPGIVSASFSRRVYQTAAASAETDSEHYTQAQLAPAV